MALHSSALHASPMYSPGNRRLPGSSSGAARDRGCACSGAAIRCIACGPKAIPGRSWAAVGLDAVHQEPLRLPGVDCHCEIRPQAYKVLPCMVLHIVKHAAHPFSAQRNILCGWHAMKAGLNEQHVQIAVIALLHTISTVHLAS